MAIGKQIKPRKRTGDNYAYPPVIQRLLDLSVNSGGEYKFPPQGIRNCYAEIFRENAIAPASEKLTDPEIADFILFAYHYRTDTARGYRYNKQDAPHTLNVDRFRTLYNQERDPTTQPYSRPYVRLTRPLCPTARTHKRAAKPTRTATITYETNGYHRPCKTLDVPPGFTVLTRKNISPRKDANGNRIGYYYSYTPERLRPDKDKPPTRQKHIPKHRTEPPRPKRYTEEMLANDPEILRRQRNVSYGRDPDDDGPYGKT